MNFTRPFSPEELCAWWEGEGTLALLPKGRKPEDCEKAQFAITQRTPIEFHERIKDALVILRKINPRACWVYDDRTTMRNPEEIKKVIDLPEPFVRTPKRKAQIAAFRAFYEARKHLFRPYTPKPRLRKGWAGR
jgi:hypothetical protein